MLLWARQPRPLRYFAFALVFGLSLGTHLSDLGFAPAFALFTALILWQRRAPFRRWLATAAVGLLGFGLGALQYAWIPLRAGTLPPGLILGRQPPTTWSGFYAYTLGAFSNLRFAFPLGALPERIALYLYYLTRQFGLGGVLLGVVGLLTMPLVRPRRFLLLVTMYLAHLAFFLEYRAFDLEVFFIPVHFIWALWMALGWYGIFRLTPMIASRAPRFFRSPLARTAGTVLTLGLLLVQGFLPLKDWSANDLSQDTAIDDFYAAVWQALPPNSTLISPGGVFGFDVLYWRLVYHTRPDVHLPALEGFRPIILQPGDDTVYATAAALQRGAKGHARPLVPPDAWAVPLVLGEQPQGVLGHRSQPLVLFALRANPPDWKVDVPPEVAAPLLRTHALTLLSAQIVPVTVESGATVHLTLAWRVEDTDTLLTNPPRLTLRLGDRALAQYTFGFGLLPRYAREVGLAEGDVLRIAYDLVIPSTVPPAEYELRLSVHGARATLGQLTVVDTH